MHSRAQAVSAGGISYNTYNWLPDEYPLCNSKYTITADELYEVRRNH